MRQIVDWPAALWAGLISGIAFLLVASLLCFFTLGSPWPPLRWLASIPMGSGVLPPDSAPTLLVALTGAVTLLVLAVGYACLIAYVLHRWGMIVGVLGGAAFGLAFYVINFYTISYFFPWFFPLRNWMILVSHIVFGAFAGGIYEALEEERFVPETEGE
jgi:hypothetical protein